MWFCRSVSILRSRFEERSFPCSRYIGGPSTNLRASSARRLMPSLCSSAGITSATVSRPAARRAQVIVSELQSHYDNDPIHQERCCGGSDVMVENIQAAFLLEGMRLIIGDYVRERLEGVTFEVFNAALASLTATDRRRCARICHNHCLSFLRATHRDSRANP